MTERPVVNAHSLGLGAPPGDRPAHRRIGATLGAAMLEAIVYELEHGTHLAPYHYEHGNERWLLVLAGHPALRHPAGEDPLDPGDVVCLPDGPDGAHELINRGEEPARVLVLETTSEPCVRVYPDSGTIEVRPPGKVFLEASALD
jgi:uncharacterized cupin superfamily protein